MESLHEKLDGLYEKLEALRIATEVLPEQMILALKSNGSSGSTQTKDVLSEEEEMTSRSPSTNGKVLSPEAQIQRLTAQLTAAYNRIAALEDQLMARRSL
ncbi:hypothetical protein [Gloeobacter kilaueensis]|uniref:Uncharacterized protein n=1 Tax=Gloeobacter kilaueensis (strain ATCC BAA-2537 / CCAP 1431/1 / ULC 316 / JS1) TaxID=1183438 RepID=U5QP11_GLOK1|nr:hypothetical protein [Gloeobacter kilaueensis]AGY60638.1 hypothetical protein GKIL_4392 [Gloeobacter kilaueensis JS1]